MNVEVNKVDNNSATDTTTPMLFPPVSYGSDILRAFEESGMEIAITTGGGAELVLLLVTLSFGFTNLGTDINANEVLTVSDENETVFILTDSFLSAPLRCSANEFVKDVRRDPIWIKICTANPSAVDDPFVAVVFWKGNIHETFELVLLPNRESRLRYDGVVNDA